MPPPAWRLSFGSLAPANLYLSKKRTGSPPVRRIRLRRLRRMGRAGDKTGRLNIVKSKQSLYPYFTVSPALLDLSERAEESARQALDAVERTTAYNQQKVLAAFIENRVSESHFTATTGYGYGDRGRDTLDAVFAQTMGAEDALVRHSIVSGTHAITIALFGILRPGDTLLAATARLMTRWNR